MNWKRHFFEAATLIAAAAICAFVSNAVASRERKLVVVSTLASGGQRAATGTKPVVPPRPAPTPEPVVPAVPATSSQQPATANRQPPKNNRQPTTASQAPPPIVAKPDTRQPVDRFPPHPDKPYVELHYDDVLWLHGKGVLFLDARRTSVFEQGHIPGARPFSVWESDIDDKVNKLFAERSDPKDQNQPIVVYCSGGDCEDSHMLAQKLWGIQFNNVYVYKDGFPDWQQHRMPVQTGTTP